MSSPVSSCRLDSIHPFDGDNFNISVLIEFVKFHAIIDTGAAVTAVETKVWNKYLSHTDCCLDSPSTSCLTSVSGSLLVILGKVYLNLLLSLLFFLFKPAIKDLTHDVSSGRDFFQKYCSRIDFVENFVPSPRTL